MIDAIDAIPDLAILARKWCEEQAEDGKLCKKLQAQDIPGVREDMSVAELLLAFEQHHGMATAS